MKLQYHSEKYSFFVGREVVFCYSSHPNFDFIMKKDIHPEYREVLFHDASADKFFLIRSTLETTQTKNGKMAIHIHIIHLIYHLPHTLSILVSKKLLIPVVEFRNLKKDLVKRSKLINLYQNFQSLLIPSEFQ